MSAEIKFCGLTRPEDAAFAASLGASYVGVIFAGGPRSLAVPRAMEVLSVVQPSVGRVGVFADQSADEIARMADVLQLNVVQLHGSFDPERISALRKHFSGEVWPVCRLSSAALPPSVAHMLSLGDGLLLDAERAQRVIDLSYRLFGGANEGDETKVDIEDYDMALSVWLGRGGVRGAGDLQAWERAHAPLPEEEQVQLLHEQAEQILEEICADDDLGL